MFKFKRFLFVGAESSSFFKKQLPTILKNLRLQENMLHSVSAFDSIFQSMRHLVVLGLFFVFGINFNGKFFGTFLKSIFPFLGVVDYRR